MHEPRRIPIGRVLALVSLGSAGVAQNAVVTPSDLINTISQRYQEAKQYSFEGDLEISRRSGAEKPREMLLKAKVKFLAAPPEKYLLRVEKTTRSSYVLVSDGQKSWTYVPSLRKYTERGASPSPTRDDPEAGLDVQSSRKGDLAEEFSHLVVPILAGLAKTAGVTDLRGSLLTVLSKKDENGHQNMTYLTLDTATLEIRRISWMNATPSGNGDKALVRSDLTFASFRIGESINEADFTFHPPKEAKRVDSLPAIPGKGQSVR